MEILREVFGLICGQVHSYSVGGYLLPFCQRCTGLYVGGSYSLLVLALFGPRPRKVWHWFHGALLLAMIPFGYHLVPQNEVVRTITGQMFGAGLLYFLSLLPRDLLKVRRGTTASEWPYLAALLAGIPLLLLAIQSGNSDTGRVLAWTGFVGLTAYAALWSANLIILSSAIWDRACRKRVPS